MRPNPPIFCGVERMAASAFFGEGEIWEKTYLVEKLVILVECGGPLPPSKIPPKYIFFLSLTFVFQNVFLLFPNFQHRPHHRREQGQRGPPVWPNKNLLPLLRGYRQTKGESIILCSVLRTNNSAHFALCIHLKALKAMEWWFTGQYDSVKVEDIVSTFPFSLQS